MPQISSFPSELLLAFFERFPLQTLIAARCVSKEWRELVSTTLIHPARRALLDLFLEIILDERYSRDRKILASDAESTSAGNPHADTTFDRELYIEQIRDQHEYLPVEFLVWILEWPEEVVIGRLSPCLPSTPRPTDDEWMTSDKKTLNYWGANMLGVNPPVVYAVPFLTDIPNFPSGPLPVLQIWRISSNDKSLLVLADSDYFREHGEVYQATAGFELVDPVVLHEAMLALPLNAPRGWVSWLRQYLNEYCITLERSVDSFRIDVELKDATTWAQWKELPAGVSSQILNDLASFQWDSE